jgi:hypothetical protein
LAADALDDRHVRLDRRAEAEAADPGQELEAARGRSPPAEGSLMDDELDVERLVRVDVLQEHGETRLSMSAMEPDGETIAVDGKMSRRERLWLVLVLLRGLWRP